MRRTNPTLLPPVSFSGVPCPAKKYNVSGGRQGEWKRWGGTGREREQAAAAVDETGNRERQGCQMSSEQLCHIVIEWFLSSVEMESLSSFRRRSMERKGRRRSMELRASLSGKILPMW